MESGRRAAFRQEVEALYAAGDPELLVGDLRRRREWQRAGFNLLRAALTNSKEAVEFDRRGQPFGGGKPLFMESRRRLRLQNQRQFLSDLLTRLDTLKLDDCWQP
jgi:hypothetical protein